MNGLPFRVTTLLRRHVLRTRPADRPAYVDKILNIASLRTQLAKIDASQERLVDAIEEGAEAKPLVARMKAAQRERDALAAKLEHLDGLQQSADSFDPVQWLADISELLSTLPTAFGVAVDPEGARRILRECLPVPLKVIPDPEGGWTYEGVGNFEQEGLQRAVKAIKGQIPPERPTGPSSMKLVPPGGSNQGLVPFEGLLRAA